MKFANLVLLFLAAASARAEIQWDKAGFGGAGCVGKIQIRKSVELGRMIVYTPEMRVALGANDRFARRYCGLAVPVEVAANERLVLSGPSVFGNSALGRGNALDANAHVYLARSEGPNVKVALRDSAKDFYRREASEVSLACGQSGNLRADATILARKGDGGAGEAEMRGFAFTARLEPCTVD